MTGWTIYFDKSFCIKYLVFILNKENNTFLRNYESKIERTKGQLISKQNCRAITSTKKRVLGEVTDQQFGFEIC